MDKPIIQFIIEDMVASGMEEIILVISPGKEQIVDHFKSHPELESQLKTKGKTAYLKAVTELTQKVKYTVVYQEKPLGLGHAVLCAREAVGSEWFFVFLPDDLIDHEVSCALQMLKMTDTHTGAMLAVMEVPWDEVHHYGVVKAHPLEGRIGKIETVVEKPKREVAPSNLAIIGRYLLPPEIFSLLTKLKPGAIGEIQLTDALIDLTKTTGLYAFQFEGDRFDIGNKLGFLEANINYALKHEGLSRKAMELIRMIAESR
jgi:UTP--glucose-1-phosphate uridylyltransferase